MSRRGALVGQLVSVREWNCPQGDDEAETQWVKLGNRLCLRRENVNTLLTMPLKYGIELAIAAGLAVWLLLCPADTTSPWASWAPIAVLALLGVRVWRQR